MLKSTILFEMLKTKINHVIVENVRLRLPYNNRGVVQTFLVHFEKLLERFDGIQWERGGHLITPLLPIDCPDNVWSKYLRTLTA